MSVSEAFVPPVYPFDRLDTLAEEASAHDGGLVDLSVGTPNDPPPKAVVEALCTSGAERGYPAGVGSKRLRSACRSYLERRFAIELGSAGLALCIGTKEFVAGLPHYLRLRDPSRDTLLYPAVSYPTYEMGARLAGCRAVAIPEDDTGGLDLGAVSASDARRSLVLWVNSPSNPTGCLSDLGAAAEFGRFHGVPVFSDECYAEYTWQGAPQTILSTGHDGVVAVHSISKRSNCAGLRLGFYAGDRDVVSYLTELRRHAGFMVPGPVQLAGAVALEDDEHVDEQRARYRARLERFIDVLGEIGVKARLPAGGFYLWIEVPADRFPHPDGPAWGFTVYLAERAGCLVSPGEFYGPYGSRHVRIALVQELDRLELVAQRLSLNA